MKHLEQFFRWFPSSAQGFTVIKMLVASVVLVSSLAGAGVLHAASTLQFSASSYTLAENAGAVSLSVQRLDGLNTVVSVDYASVDGTNELSKDVFQFESSLYTVGELDQGLKITIVRSGLGLGSSQVNYATTAGTATAGLDYWPVSDTAYFGPGQTNVTFYLFIIEDSIPEGDEAVVLALSVPASSSGNQVALGKQSTALVTIKNARNALGFFADTYSVSESDQLAVVLVQRRGDTNLACAVHYATSDLTAKAGKDYEAQSGTLVFLPGQVTNVFTVPILDNFAIDGARLIKLTLSDPKGGAVLAPRTTATLTILDDEWPVMLDPSFSINLADDSTISALVALPDGKIVLGGNFRFVGDTNKLAVARLNPDGSRDSAFKEAANVNGRLNLISALALAPDGKLVLGGQIIDSQQNYSESILRLDADGALDATFNPAETGNGYVTDLAVRTDGKILVVGTFTNLAQASRNGIARLNSDGTLDSSFNPGSGAINVDANDPNNPIVYAYVSTVRVQPDGRIIIAGGFASYNGVKRPGLARLNSDGSLDTSFDPGAGATNLQIWNTVPPPTISTLAIQEDGGILLGGSFNTAPPVILARLTGDALLDTNYRFPIMSGNASKLLVQPDGKIVIGGDLYLDGQVNFNLVRVNSDGSLDPSLSVANNNVDPALRSLGAPTAMVELPGGNLLLAGSFIDDQGTQRFQLFRLFGDTAQRHAVEFATSFDSVNESETNVVLLLQRGGDSTESLSVTVSSNDDTAKAGLDYSAVNQVVTFAPGETTKQIAASVIDDGLVEDTESFSVTLHDATAGVNLGAISRLQVNVLDNETSPSLSQELAPNVDGDIWSAVAQLDGKVIVAGDFNSVDDAPAHRIARLNPDGSLDTSFSSTEFVTPDGLKCCDGFSLLRIQPDGKILFNGTLSETSGAQQFQLARLNTDGSLDTGFNTVLETNEYLVFVELQADAKILVATSAKVWRLNSDGSVDRTFSENGSSDGTIISLFALPDGKMMVGGYFDHFNNVPRHNIVRLNSDGSLDTSFSISGDATGTGISLGNLLAVQADGKFIFSGSARNENGQERAALVRLNKDATLDETFHAGPALDRFAFSGGSYCYSGVSAALSQADGGLVVWSVINCYRHSDGRAFRLRADGSWDSEAPLITPIIRSEYDPVYFGFANYPARPGSFLVWNFFISQEDNNPRKLALIEPMPPTKTVFTFDSRDYFASRKGGTLEVAVLRRGDVSAQSFVRLTFSSSSPEVIQAILPAVRDVAFAPLETEKSISFQISSLDNATIDPAQRVDLTLSELTGDALLDRATAHLTIVDEEQPGTIDPAFDARLTSSADYSGTVVGNIQLLDDGHVRIWGSFDSVHGQKRNGFAQLNADGSLDTSFADTNSPPRPLAVQPDGKILTLGYCQIQRYNPDGTLDPTFNAIVDPYYAVSTAVVQPDGKIIIGGSFTTINGTFGHGVARLNADGSLDATFKPHAGPRSSSGDPGTITALALEADGQIVVGGYFASLDQTACNGIARLNPDGSVDASFNPSPTQNMNQVNAIAVQPDRKILVLGFLSLRDPTGPQDIVRLNTDGSLDPSFALAGVPINSFQLYRTSVSLLTMVLLPDGGLLVGGAFARFGKVPRAGIVRINLSLVSELAFTSAAFLPDGSFQLSISSQAGRAYELQASDELRVWSAIATKSASGATLEFEDKGAVLRAARFYRVVSK